MGRLRDATLILGEGPTEFYYFKSLCSLYKQINIHPDYPKHTSIVELEAKIAAGVKMGYRYIFCIIDMDDKSTEPEHRKYVKLRAKYSNNVISKPKQGIYCQVEFFETHRCTELFFEYYFRYTSRAFENQDQLLKDLNKCVLYEKTSDFFLKSKGLHTYFEKNGGSLETAKINAERSLQEKASSGRDYTYSELGRLMRRLAEINGQCVQSGYVSNHQMQS